MCGILGINVSTSSEKISDQFIKNGLKKIHFRGPDHSDYVDVGQWIMGHTRLSIIDTSANANQPMTDNSGQYTIIFNGEIYNFQDLKNNLLANGIQFSTQSDTEVLLYHLIQNGKKGIPQLNGCFSFAFYDKSEKRMILARDPMGINPLFYTKTKNHFAFSSSVKAIFEIFNPTVKFSEQWNQYFRYGYIPGSPTLFKDVKCLTPGEVMEIDDKNQTTLTWIPPETKHYSYKSISDAEKRLADAIESAVIQRLQADVPLGCFLSGGIDSSIISLIASRNKTDVNTFSIGIEDQKFYDESNYAEEVAQYIGSAHHTIRLNEDLFNEHFEDFMDALDYPFADSSAINVFFLAKETRKHVTVALSGDGADELFGGYQKHSAFVMANKKNMKNAIINLIGKSIKGQKTNADSHWSNVLRKIQKFSTLLNTPDEEKIEFLAAFGEEKFIQQLTGNSGKSNLYEAFDHNDFQELLLRDQKLVLPGDMLSKVDMMSMRNSLEVRTPFLDKEVVNIANQLPKNLKNNGKLNKIILRNIYKSQLPTNVFKRPKQGFEVPVYKWLINKIDYFEKVDYFHPDYIAQQKLFDPSIVSQLIEDFKKQKYSAVNFHFWSLIVFQEWYTRNKKYFNA